MNNICAIASVVIKEMYRRKDFYVLLVLTVVITASMGSVHFFNDDKIVRYLKETCLLLIWISSLFIAIATIAPIDVASRRNRLLIDLASCELPALADGQNFHARSSFRPSRSLKTAKTDLTRMVGRLHYSLGFTPSAQFR